MKREELILLPESVYRHSVTDIGLAISNRWWLATNDDRIVFYTKDEGRNVSFQSNVDENVICSVLRHSKFPVRLQAKKVDLVFCSEKTSPVWKRLWAKYNAAIPTQQEVRDIAIIRNLS